MRVGFTGISQKTPGFAVNPVNPVYFPALPIALAALARLAYHSFSLRQAALKQANL